MSTSYLIAGYSRYAAAAEFPAARSGLEELFLATSPPLANVGAMPHASYGFGVVISRPDAC
jgi:hypothetical protein